MVLAPASLPNVCTPFTGCKGEFDIHLNDGIAKVIFRADLGEESASCA